MRSIIPRSLLNRKFFLCVCQEFHKSVHTIPAELQRQLKLIRQVKRAESSLYESAQRPTQHDFHPSISGGCTLSFSQPMLICTTFELLLNLLPALLSVSNHLQHAPWLHSLLSNATHRSQWETRAGVESGPAKTFGPSF